MNCNESSFRMKKMIFAVLSVIPLLSAGGCSLLEIHKQTTLVDNVGSIKGQINVVSDQKGPVMVLRFLDVDGIPVLERRLKASEDGEYQFPAPPGQHYIAAFIDVNGDERYQPEEHGNFYGVPTALTIGAKETVTIDTITISGPLPRPAIEVKPVERTLPIWTNIGQIVNLDDPRFTLDNYTMGLWKPIDFLQKAEGGLFFLEEYRKDKVPVLFIHGVVNGPSLWTEVVAAMDGKHFQPWLFYYPSGLRLDMISDFLVEAVTQLHDKYHFKEFYVVAHSMGGLITRSFVKKYVERDPQNSSTLRLAMTVNSPFNGMAAASSGVKHSPVVVPSWRDVEPGSEFLQGIHAWNWPEEIEYHLVVSYFDGESGDGVVPLQSQAQSKLQAEATRIYLFNDEHTGTINNKDFHNMLNKALEERRQN